MPSVPSHVVIAGGGVGALETMLALRELAGERVRITLIAPDAEFVLRPMLIAEPFGAGETLRVPLCELARELGVELYPSRLTAVEPRDRLALTAGGERFVYDALVLAPGATALPAFDHVVTLGDERGRRELTARLQDAHSAAFIVVSRTGWPLPAYEGALLSARRMDSVTLITAEERPVEVLGPESSARVAKALDAGGVRLVHGQVAGVEPGTVHMLDGSELHADLLVSTPLLRGPRIEGVPAEGIYRLIATDDHGRVTGLRDVYAVGDATTFALKHGDITTQQALAVAEQIAAHAGAELVPAPFAATVRGLLLTGGEPVALGEGASSKLPGRYLGPYFAATGRVVLPDVGEPARS